MPEQDRPEQDRAKREADEKKRTNFTTTGDGTAWDSGRTSSITEGSRVERDLREADAESPGVTGPKPGRDKTPDSESDER